MLELRHSEDADWSEFCLSAASLDPLSKKLDDGVRSSPGKYQVVSNLEQNRNNYQSLSLRCSTLTFESQKLQRDTSQYIGLTASQHYYMLQGEKLGTFS